MPYMDFKTEVQIFISSANAKFLLITQKPYINKCQFCGITFLIVITFNAYVKLSII